MARAGCWSQGWWGRLVRGALWVPCQPLSTCGCSALRYWVRGAHLGAEESTPGEKAMLLPGCSGGEGSRDPGMSFLVLVVL